MAQFSYRATTAEGQVVEGLLEAEAESAVVASLRGQGYIPLEIRAGAVLSGTGAGGLSERLRGFVERWRRRVGYRELSIFTRELATLINAGLPLDRCLQSLSALTESEALRSVIKSVLLDVQQGKSLSDALAGHDDVFPPLYVNMVRAGEAGGVLEVILARLSDYLEQTQKVRDEVRSAMTYPIFLALFGAVMVIVLLTYVLPRFAVLFEDLGGALPTSTRIVMGASEGFRQYWWALLALIGILAEAFRRYIASPAGRFRFDRFKLDMPLLGVLFTKIQVSRLARTLGTMLKSGVPLIKSLEIVKAVVGNVVIGHALTSVQHEVSEGKGLALPLERTGVFPPLALQMVGVGEDTGRLDEMLLIVSDHYERDISNHIKSLMSLVGPVVLIVMGAIVTFIVVSVMVAIFSVNELIE